MGRFKDDRYPDVASFKAALLSADAQTFQPGSGALLPGPSSAGAPTLANMPSPPAVALDKLWLEAYEAYVFEQWAHAEALLIQVAALKPDYEDVQELLAKAHLHAERERGYAQMQALRAADAWLQVIDLFAKLPPDFPDPQQHRLWAAVRQRRDQHHKAALLARKNKAWREMLDRLTALLAEAPGDAAAIKLQAHAQAKWDEAERQRKEAERLEAARIQHLLPAMVEIPAGPFLMGSSDHPWGNTWEAGRCNSEEANIEGTTPVVQYPTGVSPYGALDLAGNVWDLMAELWPLRVAILAPLTASQMIAV